MEHVQSWEPPNESETGTYASITKLRENKDFRTVDELDTNAYPENVMLVCYFPTCGDEEKTDEVIEDKKYDGRGVKSHYGVEKEESLYECEIVEKAARTITARVFCSTSGTSYLVTNYSNDLVTFRMKRYRSDQHLPGTFRHHIQIEDSIFPEQWKNLKQKDTVSQSQQ